ncbi:MAG TPA: deoxynucleoside kinase [Prolixibacteraceae bacterium]|nr:deoxynucleoside kinase [Prolixibacteraceae bacterium]
MSIDYLVIEGNIGAGKTTLATMLSADLNSRLILEGFSDNPFLPKFYSDPAKYSFPLELSFLAERYSQLKNDLASRDLFHKLTIMDYYFMKSLIFAQNTLAPDEYNLYRKFFDIIYERLPKPDLYVYLHIPEDKLIENIRLRGRDYEQSIESGYLKTIKEGYFNFFSQQTDFPVLIIDTTNVDFVKNKAHYQLIKELIFENSYSSGVSREILNG